MNTTRDAERVQLVARNIGGIDQTEVELDSGATILEAELDRKLDELGDVRSELEDVRFDIETQEDSLKSLRKERRTVSKSAFDFHVSGSRSRARRTRTRSTISARANER